MNLRENAWFPFPGEMARLTGNFAWHTTPLGPIDAWPQSLRTTVATLLECRLPMYLAWGPERIQLYNDAYRPILGHKHADALGQPAPVTWSEIWPTIGPMWDRVLGGEPVGFDDFKLTIERYGYPEDCYFNFSYSPVRDESGTAKGVLVTFAETTKRVAAERRLKFLDDLSLSQRALDDPSEVMRQTAVLLGSYLGANRCAYAHVLDDQDTFDLVGDYNDGVDSIVGRYCFTDFGAEVTRLMQADLPYVNADVDTDPQTAGTDLSAYRRTRIQAVICVPLHKNQRFVAAMAVHQSIPRRWTEEEVELVRTVVDRCWTTLERLRAQTALREEARSLEILNLTGAALSAELDHATLLQRVTDAATELTGARVGVFVYRDAGASGEDNDGVSRCVASGMTQEQVALLERDHPELLTPRFDGAQAIRLDDIQASASGAASAGSQQAAFVPLRSYLAVPVASRSGELIGALVFGHPAVAVFNERSQRLAVGIASQAAIAIDNARLYARSLKAAQEREQLLESERAARATAERAGVVKDEFLATLSHELRTPLNSIVGWAHILEKKVGHGDPGLRKGVEVIHRSANAQAQLIDDLLDMSRITSGKLSLDMQPLALAPVVHAAIDMVQPTLASAGLEVLVQIEPSGPVRGDAERLKQVVWNLLTNAIKFTARGGTITVSVAMDRRDVVLTVADTGIGIAPDILPAIFRRFTQADSSARRRFGGLGLGLSIVKHLLHLHGGSITAHSDGEGQGASFSARIPLLDPVALSASSSSVAKPETTLDFKALTGLRVLAVDDNQDVRELLQRVLVDAGATVDAADGADEAMALLTGRTYDVIISDIGMPGTDGYAFMRQLRSKPAASGSRTPAIALTAFARPEDRHEALAAGYTLHCTKPADPSVIVNAVRTAAAQPH